MLLNHKTTEKAIYLYANKILSMNGDDNAT